MFSSSGALELDDRGLLMFSCVFSFRFYAGFSLLALENFQGDRFLDKATAILFVFAGL